jgi:long-subunit acyl-CoA synthetase (AMP-forming)
MEKKTDDQVTVSMVKETRKRFPNLNACSFDKGFHSPENQDALKQYLELVALPRKGKLSQQTQAVEQSEAFYARLDAAPLAIAERKSDDPAWLFYTSGTTGRPKGVTLTQRNILSAVLNYFSDVDTIARGDAISMRRRCRTAPASICCRTLRRRASTWCPSPAGSIRRKSTPCCRRTAA